MWHPLLHLKYSNYWKIFFWRFQNIQRRLIYIYIYKRPGSYCHPIRDTEREGLKTLLHIHLVLFTRSMYIRAFRSQSASLLISSIGCTRFFSPPLYLLYYMLLYILVYTYKALYIIIIIQKEKKSLYRYKRLLSDTLLFMLYWQSFI